MKPLSAIPNIDGFEFIGVRHNGTLARCVVRQGDDELHVIEGEATYWELVGWWHCEPVEVIE